MSGNTVWPQASSFQKTRSFLHFLRYFCPRKCWMILFLLFSNTVHYDNDKVCQSSKMLKKMFYTWKLACLFWWCCNYALVTKKLHNFSRGVTLKVEKLPLDWEFPWLHHHTYQEAEKLRFVKDDLCTRYFLRSETHWHLIFKLFHSHFIKDFFLGRWC